MIFYDVSSLWEIAHRWHNYDPNLSDPSCLPLDVQDNLRFLTRLLALAEYPLANRSGFEMKS